MAKGVCSVALVLAAFTSTCKACTFGHAGFCVAKVAGDKAAADGVVIPDASAVSVKKGDAAPKTGLWMPGCSLVAKDAKAPSAGKFWSTVSATPTAVVKDGKAASAGVFCPTAKVASCKHVKATTKAEEAGVAIPDGAAYAVKKDAVAPKAGFYCEGCMLLTKETEAPEAGKHWTTPSATPTSVAKGAKASKGVFCKDSLKKTGGGTAGTAGAAGTAGTAKVTSGAGAMTSLSAAAFLSMLGVFGH
jgi:hypothetical protein